MAYFNFQKNFTKPLWLTLLVVFLISGLALTLLTATNYDRTVLGLTLAGIDISGIDRSQVKQSLADQINKFSHQKISFIFEDKNWELAPAELGLTLDLDQTTLAAQEFGHGQALAALAEQVSALFKKADLPLAFSLNSAKMDNALLAFSTVATPAKNASLKYDPAKDDFVVLPSQNGTAVNRAKLINDVMQTFNAPSRTVHLSLAEEQPSVTEKEISQVAEEAKLLIANAPYFLQSPSASWPIDKVQLASWVSAQPSNNDPQKAQLTLDPQQISDFLVPLSASINREPTNAKLATENGKLKFVALSQDGEKLNVEASTKKITEDILAGQKNISLITDSVAPTISNQTTQELGLLTLLGTGESNFSGSPTNRRVNIKVGATKLNGFLIEPGEEFSFSANIGEIDAQNGWVPELVIKNRQTVPEYGGGLCQVSTTLFRAAVNSGLKIIERHPHAYPVHYYDPPGFDATVYPPNPDLKFLNDTPGHLLLQTRIEGNKLFFEIYGTNDGREVKVIGPVTTQKNPNGSLKATLTQEIWRNGQLERKQVFNSNYNSPALYPNPNAAKPSPAPSPAVSGSPAPSPTTTPAPTN